MADQSIGGISVRITGDFSDLSADIAKATAEAQAGGQAIASAFNNAMAAAAGGADQLASSFKGIQDAMQFLQNNPAVGNLTKELDALVASGLTASQAATTLAEAYKRIGDSAQSAVSPLQQVGQAAQGTSFSFGQIAQAAAAFVGVEVGIRAIASALKELAESAIGTFAQIERTTIALTSLTGNVERATATISLLKIQALDQALSFPQLVEANQRVLALGFSSKQASDSLRAAADAAAATGLSFAQISPAMDRIAQSGQVVGRQLSTIGLTLQDLAKAAGVTTDQVRDLFKNLDPGERLDLLIKALQKFQGTAEAVSKSLSGQFQNLKTETTLALSGIGEALAPLLKQLMEVAQTSAIPAIEALVAAFRDLGSVVGPIVSDVLSGAITKISDIAAVIGGAVSGISALNKAFAEATTQATGMDLSFTGIASKLDIFSKAMHVAATEVELMRGQVDFWNQSALVMGKRFADVTESLKTFIDTAANKSGILGIRLEFEAQQKAIADARAELENATKANEQFGGMIGIVHQKQDALNKALRAADPALKGIATATRQAATFNENFATSIQKAVDGVRNYEAGTSTLASTQAALNTLMERSSLIWNKLSEASKDLVISLIPITNQLKETASSAAFDTLMTKVTDLGIKYPAAIQKIDSATMDFLNSLRGLNALEIKDFSAPIVQALEKVLASQQALDASSVQLIRDQEAGEKAVVAFGATLVKAFDGGNESAQRLAQKIKMLGVESGLTGQLIISDFNLINSLGFQTITQMERYVEKWNEAAKAAERLKLPLSEQLAVLKGAVQIQLDYNAAIGAGADVNLKLAQTITAISLAQFALHQQTMGQADLWRQITTDALKEFDQLGQSLAQAWFAGETGAKALMSTLKKLGEQIVGDLVQGALKDLAASLIKNSGLMQSLGITSVETVKTATDAIATTTSTASKSITQIATQAVSSISSLVSLVSSVIGAITGIIGNIEMAHMEKTLGQIETNTRQIFNAVGAGSQSVAGTSLLSSQYLGGILETLQGAVITLLVDISANLDEINAKIGNIAVGGGEGSGLMQTINDLRAQLQILTEQFNQQQLANLSAPATKLAGSGTATPTGSAAVDYSGINAGTPAPVPMFVPTVMETLLANIASTAADILEALVTEFGTSVQATHARAISDAMSGFLNIPLDLLAKVATGFPNLMATLNGTAQNLGAATQGLTTATNGAATASQTLATASTAVAATLGSTATAIATVSNAILGISSVLEPLVLGKQQMLLAAQLPTGTGPNTAVSSIGGSALGSQVNLTINIPGTIVGPGGIDGVTTAVADQLVNKLATKGIRLTRG